MITPQFLWQLVLRTIVEPRAAAEVVLGLGLSRAVLWQVLILICALSAVFMGAFGSEHLALPIGTSNLLLTPVGYAFVLGAGLVMMVFALHYTGAALDGQGRFAESLAAVVWIEVVALCFRVLQILVAALFGNSIAALLSFAGVAILLWALLHFINQVHQFDSLLRAAGTFILAVLGIGLGMSIIIAFIGVGTGLTLPTGG